MTLIRSSPFARIVAGLGLLLVCPPLLGAQSFVEVGGGWNYLGARSEGSNYTNGFNLRASFGRELVPNFQVRYDAFVSQFDNKLQLALPCPSTGCTGAAYDVHSQGVAGLTVNGILGVDPRGTFYVIGGGGLYDAFGPATEMRLGVSAGAGIAVPLGGQVRAIVEARWHGLIGATAGPPWLVPITFGLRF